MKKINISMDFIKPFAGTLKKYSSLLPSVAITVVAILLFLPTMIIGGKVKENMQKSAQTANSIRSLTDPPSKYQPDTNQRYLDELGEEKKRIEEAVKQSSQRDLVTYDYIIFPKPNDPSSQVYIEFGRSFRRAIEDLIKEINASDAPSDFEIRRRAGGPATPAANRFGGDGGVDTQNPMIDALCQTRAQEISVYANASAFKWYEFWDNYEFSGKDQALEDCWDTQVAFWIYKDIVDTIGKLNGSSVKVLSAPVKRLLGVSFSGPVVVESGRRGLYADVGGTGLRDAPNYITQKNASNFLDPSPTARAGNEDVDIVHFAVSVLLDHQTMMPFMMELCSEKLHSFYPSVFEEPFMRQGDPVESRHNQITILQSDIKAIDKSKPEHSLYRYGKGAVVQLDLICEYQFDRSGYDRIKPEPVKKRLDQLDESTEDAAGNPPGIGMPGVMPY